MEQDKFFREISHDIAKIVIKNKLAQRSNLGNIFIYTLSDIEVVFEKHDKMIFKYIAIRVIGTSCLIHADGSVSLDLPIKSQPDYSDLEDVTESRETEDIEFVGMEIDQNDDSIIFVEDKNMLLIISSYLKWRYSVLQKFGV